MPQPVQAFLSIVSLLTAKVSCPVAHVCKRHLAGARRTTHVRYCQRALARTDIAD